MLRRGEAGRGKWSSFRHPLTSSSLRTSRDSAKLYWRLEMQSVVMSYLDCEGNPHANGALDPDFFSRSMVKANAAVPKGVLEVISLSKRVASLRFSGQFGSRKSQSAKPILQMQNPHRREAMCA